MLTMQDLDPFDPLFSLEDTFYAEGYSLGAKDGQRAGLIEGRLTGLEKGFEKYATMGCLHGKAVVWTGRLRLGDQTAMNDGLSEVEEKASARDAGEAPSHPQLPPAWPVPHPLVPSFSPQISPRLEKHVRTLYALVEPRSLSIHNTEDSVSDFDDRLKRAKGRVKVIEKITGEESSGLERSRRSAVSLEKKAAADGGSIEDSDLSYARQSTYLHF